MIVDNLDCADLAFGALGAVLWAHNGKWTKYAAIFNLASSILWTIYSCFHGTPAFIFSNCMYVFVNTYACTKWLGARKESSEQLHKPIALEISPPACHLTMPVELKQS